MRYLKKEYWEQFTKTVPQNDKEKVIRDGLEFEELVQNLLFLKFQGNWQRTKKTHDQNRDFYLYSEQERIWAECKNYQTPIAMSTLAPTLVMAQIFDVDQIIFFSYSPINDSAKRKIFSFGKKVNKKICIYDDYKLEELIMRAGDRLPLKFRPVLCQNPVAPSGNAVDIQVYARTEPTIATDEELSDFIPYKKLTKVFYNKTFAIYFFITNTSSLDSYDVKIHVKPDRSSDILNFRFLDSNIQEITGFSRRISVDYAEGTVVQGLIKPVIYKGVLELPIFEIEIWNKGVLLYTWQSENVSVRCVWIGQTKLIGSNYEDIIDTISSKIFLRNKIGVAAIYGGSGTGKTRLLTELMDILLQQQYRILNFIGMESDESLNIIKEIVYFLYEIPRSRITDYWEKHQLDLELIEEASGMALRGFKLLEKIMSAKNTSDLEEYYDLIFERISRLHVALIFDNVQYYNNKVMNFIQKYIIYSQNQNSCNNTVVLCVFNTDFSNRQSTKILNEIRLTENDSDNIYTQKIAGFKNENQAILFLRELVHLQTDENDFLFHNIIQKVTTKPYYLHQAVKYLEENNAIYHSPLQQGFLIDNQVFRNVVMKMPDNITDLLKRRYAALQEYNDQEQLNMVLSTVFLFTKIDSFVISRMALNNDCIENLVRRGFLIQLHDCLYTFEHDIIRTFLSDHIVALEEPSINYIIENRLIDEFVTYPFQHSFVMLYKKRLGKRQFKDFIISMVSKNDIPLYLYDKFYRKLFTSTIKKEIFFDSFGDWMNFLYGICKNIRDKLGSTKALESYYQPLYQILLNKETECFQNISLFRSFIMSYTDLLSHLKMNGRAIDILKIQLENAKRYEDKFGNGVIAFKAIVCNRLHVNFKDFSDEKNQTNQKKYLKMSEDITKLIVNDSERHLLEYSCNINPFNYMTKYSPTLYSALNILNPLFN